LNKIRERAYSTTSPTLPNPNNIAQPIKVDWMAGDATLDNILAERARELAWEAVRRTDLIRYEVASGQHYFSAARNPSKTQDGDGHWQVFPIPTQQITSNANLKPQNPGY
jgi:hypothetical protein